MIDEPRCRQRSCKHYRGLIGSTELDQRPACAAFPDGIPSEIAFGNNLHAEPFAGDRGLQFEQGETEETRNLRLAIEQRDALNESLRTLGSLI